MKGSVVKEIDGGHDSLSNIYKAKYLHQQLFNNATTEFMMVKVQKSINLLPNESWVHGINRLVKDKKLSLLSIPPHRKPKVNETALSTMKQILSFKG